MAPYTKDVELAMVTFFGSLREKDRRRYAAVEAAKDRRKNNFRAKSLSYGFFS